MGPTVKFDDSGLASLNPCLNFYAAHSWNPYLTDKAISMLVFVPTIWLIWIFGRVEVTDWCTQMVGIVFYFIFQASFSEMSSFWSLLAVSFTRSKMRRTGGIAICGWFAQKWECWEELLLKCTEEHHPHICYLTCFAHGCSTMLWRR